MADVPQAVIDAHRAYHDARAPIRAIDRKQKMLKAMYNSEMARLQRERERSLDETFRPEMEFFQACRMHDVDAIDVLRQFGPVDCELR